MRSDDGLIMDRVTVREVVGYHINRIGHLIKSLMERADPPAAGELRGLHGPIMMRLENSYFVILIATFNATNPPSSF